ncbi:hypothetical protein M9H77_07891 [Catharanthus roseus]|uniref:Uncharacterized protein n=1 Tax=Catharanthus roseus TaxID=4058 RepID=A0ACC0BWD3_CATRO|nr:hypothetical protein M9H77_07891 [Catharanthus roseus]
MDEIKLSLDDSSGFDIDSYKRTQKGLASRSLAEEFVVWIPVEDEAYKAAPPQRTIKTLSVVQKPQASTYKSWPKKEDTLKVAFKDHSKPKMEEKGRLITNPTRCCKCNGVEHIAINYPTKRTLVFSEDLDGWIEKSYDDCQESIVDKEESGENKEIASFEAKEEGMSLVTIRASSTQVHEEETNIQRENIFHTKYLVGGKVANLIIDNGSCTNVASTYLVKKLNLPLIQHPKPYKLHWLNDSGESTNKC